MSWPTTPVKPMNNNFPDESFPISVPNRWNICRPFLMRKLISFYYDLRNQHPENTLWAYFFLLWKRSSQNPFHYLGHKVNTLKISIFLQNHSTIIQNILSKFQPWKLQILKSPDFLTTVQCWRRLFCCYLIRSHLIHGQDMVIMTTGSPTQMRPLHEFSLIL